MIIFDWWPAPAKLNLFLHVTGRRPDGYHLLQTVFQFIDYGDRLAFVPREDGEIVRIDPLAGIALEQDLCVRAAHLLQQYTGVSAGVEIHLDKCLPLGGGLGGGSSDAATTLLALNFIWNTGLNVDQLAELGLRLGADVPVFIYGHTAWAEGVGERLEVINLSEPWYIVLTPDCRVSTAEIFSDPELKRDCQPITIGGFLSGQGMNVCEAVVRKHYKPVATALDWLAGYGSPRMSGTGACVYLALSDRAKADAILQDMPVGWKFFVARGLNRSPVLDKLERIATC